MKNMENELIKTIKELRDELSFGPLYKVRPGFDPWEEGGLPEYSDFEEIDLEELLTKIDGVLDDLE
jgi:hypothetical protein